MSVYKYAVTSKKGIKVNTIDSKLTQVTSKSTFPYIPEAAIPIHLSMSLDNRSTVYFMSQADAIDLRSDPDVLAVEIVPMHGTASAVIHGEHNSGEISSSIIITGAPMMLTSSSQPGNFVGAGRGGAGPSYVSVNDLTGSYPLHRSVGHHTAMQSSANRSPIGFMKMNWLGTGSYWDDDGNRPYNNETSYNYPVDGTGVDIIFSDPGMDLKHADFKDISGNFRFNFLDWADHLSVPKHDIGFNSTVWYQGGGSHGTYMASMCAGTVTGAAKGASLYFIKTRLNADTIPNFGVSLSDSFHVGRLFHLSKSIAGHAGYAPDRPTIFVQSINMYYSSKLHINSGATNSMIVSHSYLGNVVTDSSVPANLPFHNIPKGLMQPDGMHPFRQTSTDVAAEQMCDAGVIFVTSAGNGTLPIFESGSSTDPDFDPNNVGWYGTGTGAHSHYDNFYVHSANSTHVPGNEPIYYMRGGSPQAHKAIKVGQLTPNLYYSTSSFTVSPNSCKGPRVDINAYGSSTGVAYGEFGTATPGIQWTNRRCNFTSSFFPSSFSSSLYTPAVGQPYYKSSSKWISFSLGSAGTSFSGPNVAGVIALYLQLNPKSTSRDIKRWLYRNASEIDGGNAMEFSHGGQNQPHVGGGGVTLLGGATRSALYSPFTSSECGILSGGFTGLSNLTFT